MAAPMNMNPADSQAARKVVLGCMKLLFDPKTHGLLVADLKKDAPMPAKLAMAAVGVMKTFSLHVTNGQIPRQVLIPAATMLLLEIAKFMAKAGLGKPTGKDIAAAGPLLVNLVKQAFPAGGGAPTAAAPAAAPAAQPAGMIAGGQ